VVKSLLRYAGLNVPFSGGLSSYSIFLLVVAAFDSYAKDEHRLAAGRGSDARLSIFDLQTAAIRRLSSEDTLFSQLSRSEAETETERRETEPQPPRGGESNHDTPTPILSSEAAATTAARNNQSLSHLQSQPQPQSQPQSPRAEFICEGEIFLQFLYMFARKFDPSMQGVGKLASSRIIGTPYLPTCLTATSLPTFLSSRARTSPTSISTYLSHFLHDSILLPLLLFSLICPIIDVRDAGGSPIVFDLSAEQRASVGTSCWITDPLDPEKNVARPSFAFAQVQAFLEQCLETIEREGARLQSNNNSSNSSNNSSGNNSSHNSSHNNSKKMNRDSSDSGGGNKVDLLRCIMRF
jgi:hypothetical protein